MSISLQLIVHANMCISRVESIRRKIIAITPYLVFSSIQRLFQMPLHNV